MNTNTNGTQQAQTDFEIPFTPEYRSTIKADDGKPTEYQPIGHVTLKITDLGLKAEANQKHVMTLVTFSIARYHDPSIPAQWLGAAIEGLYAGSRESPDKMKRRLENFLQAAKVQTQPGQGIKKSMLIGREIDATIIWETSPGKADPNTGMTRQFVNPRVRYERPVGTQAPAHANALLDSRAAARVLMERNELPPELAALFGDLSGGAGGATMGQETVAPWASQPAQGAPATTQTATPVADQGPTLGTTEPTFMSEDEVQTKGLGEDLYVYRAHAQLDTAGVGPNAREILKSMRIDPNGPVDPTKLTDAALKAQWLAKFPPAGAAATATGLPKLPPLGGGQTGTRA